MKYPFAFSLALLLSSQVGISGCQSDSDPNANAAGAPGANAGSPSSMAGAASAGSPSAGQAGSGAQVAGGGGVAANGGASGGGASGAGLSQAGQGSAVAGAGAGGSGGAGDLPPLTECTGKASIDRLTDWQASGEGATLPATGSILVKEGDAYIGKVQFVGADWHVIPVLIANRFGTTADLTASKGMTLTYSATSELHVQLRSSSHWNGGDQYAATIAATAGQKKTLFVPFAATAWASLFGAPQLSYADTLKEGMGLVFVGNSANDVVFYGLRIDGFTPACP
jgi:hypothetical protein